MHAKNIIDISTIIVYIQSMTQKINTLPKHPREDEAEMDKMSEAAFAGYGLNKPHLYDWAKDEKDDHFIDRPELPTEKPVELFIAELHNEVAAREAGKMATGNVISIDVNSVSSEYAVPVTVEHSDVA